LLHEASVTNASANATVTAIIEASFGFTVLSLAGRLTGPRPPQRARRAGDAAVSRAELAKELGLARQRLQQTIDPDRICSPHLALQGPAGG
jgi:hypothetical protein